jgi:hypothetical protein
MRFVYWIGGSLVALVVVAGTFFLINDKPVPATITYGMSFNAFYAEELGLDWKETYDAVLDELGARHLRLAAHWPMVEPSEGQYSFVELDYQLDRAEDVDADVILAVGRRLPRWPECHIPEWAKELSWEEQKEHIRDYLTAVVTRYQDRSNIIYWQVENEPYLGAFAKEHCDDLDEEFLLEEISLVREIDPTRPILLTDSGNLGTWFGAYKNGDAFGTSVYVYFWNPELGQFKSALPPWFYRAKEAFIQIIHGTKPTYLIELSAEPWLLEPITNVDVETQYSRMNADKIREIVDYAAKTRYDRQYLWGAEWWYWLKLQGHDEIWGLGKELFNR